MSLTYLQSAPHHKDINGKRSLLALFVVVVFSQRLFFAQEGSQFDEIFLLQPNSKLSLFVPSSRGYDLHESLGGLHPAQWDQAYHEVAFNHGTHHGRLLEVMNSGFVSCYG